MVKMVTMCTKFVSIERSYMFTKEEIDEFKQAMDRFGWVDSCVITPELISFSDKMYHRNWRLLPNESKTEGRRYYPIHAESNAKDGVFKQCNAGLTVMEAMKRLDERLWFWATTEKDADYGRMNSLYCMLREEGVRQEYGPMLNLFLKEK